MGAKMPANLKLLTSHFHNGVLFKSTIAFRKLTPASEVQVQEKKSKRNVTALNMGNKLTKCLTDKISHDQMFICHVNIVLSVCIE